MQHLPPEALHNARWRTREQLRAGEVPAGLRAWLFDGGSLTRRLVAASGGAFRVEVQRQDWGHAAIEEARLLGHGARRACRLREVLLLGAGVPWVYARSVLPESSLRGRNRFLRQLRSRPLGALLFQSPDTERRRVDYARLDGRGFPGNESDAPVWGRRSVFVFHGQPLLVGEYFLPVLAATPFPGR